MALEAENQRLRTELEQARSTVSNTSAEAERRQRRDLVPLRQAIAVFGERPRFLGPRLTNRPCHRCGRSVPAHPEVGDRVVEDVGDEPVGDARRFGSGELPGFGEALTGRRLEQGGQLGDEGVDRWTW